MVLQSKGERSEGSVGERFREKYSEGKHQESEQGRELESSMLEIGVSKTLLVNIILSYPREYL